MGLVLSIEDDSDFQLLISVQLSEFGHQVLRAKNLQSGIELTLVKKPDLILLDINLGEGSRDGLEAVTELRKLTEVPIVFLTGRNDEIDQIVGLTLGADDYLIKPISPRVLAAKVGAVLRRRNSLHYQSAKDKIQIGNLCLDYNERSCTINGQKVSLTRIQFDLLMVLAESPNHVVTREALLDKVWGDSFSENHNLDVHLSRLRSKVAEAGGPRVAQVIRGVGFRFSDPGNDK